MPPQVSSCPAPDTLERFALGRLSESDSATLHDHLASCTTCSDTVQGLRHSSTGQPLGRTGQNGPEPTRMLSGQFPFLTPAGHTNELGRLGPYRILKVLGEGGMGIVFQAQDSTLERLVALKIMKPEASTSEVARKRFNQEARAAASIQHDHIVTIYHVGEDNGIPYLAMPFLAGESLESRLRRENRLPVSEILRIGREVAEGLAAAHARGMIHRDIKPANIWLEDMGPDVSPRVKILDFGLARVTGDQFQNLTKTGVVMGTPGYMAPEQARGFEKIDHRCDLFSLGCVLYHMLMGREPFRREDVMATLMALALDEPPPIRQLNPDAPQALVDLVNKLMAKSPDGRPISVASVGKTLAEITRSLDAAAPTSQIQKAESRKPKAEKTDSQSSNSGIRASDSRDTAPQQVKTRPSWERKPTPEAGKPEDSSASGDSSRPSWERRRPSWERPRPEASPPAPAQSPAAAGAGIADKPASGVSDPGYSAGLSTSDSATEWQMGHCPRCGTPRTEAGKGWCLSCGYFPEKEEAPAPADEKTKGVPKWAWYLLAGMVVIIAASILGDLMLPKHCAARAWWGTSQLGLGILIIIIADVLAYLYVLPTGGSVSFVDMLLPIQMWIAAFEKLPKTRKPVCLLGWGLTTLLSAVFLVGGQLWWFKKHPTHTGFVASSNKAEEQEKEDLDSELDQFDSPEGVMDKKDDLDDDDETDMDKDTTRPLRGRYVVVGYLPGENQGIAGLVVASQGESKLEGIQSILFSPQVPQADANRFVSGLKVVADPPGGTSNIKAIWVEPKKSCWISYDSIDENGTLQNPLFKKWETPKKPAEPK